MTEQAATKIFNFAMVFMGAFTLLSWRYESLDPLYSWAWLLFMAAWLNALRVRRAERKRARWQDASRSNEAPDPLNQ